MEKVKALEQNPVKNEEEERMWKQQVSAAEG